MTTPIPIIPMAEYAERRRALMQQIGASSLAIVPAAPEIFRNGDTHYSYRQQSDFFYLTGFAEPEAIVVLAPGRSEGEYLLFNRVRNRDREIWDGPRAGQEGACQSFLADQAFPIEQFEEMLPELLLGRQEIHYSIGLRQDFDNLILKALGQVRAKIRSGIAAPATLVDIAASLHELRLIKSSAEIAVIQHAVDISVDAHLRAMQACQPGSYEYELEAACVYEFIRHGARSPAYPSIVGGGPNSCILHYVSNDRKINDGDLVLIDAGAEYGHYASDITRTFPANGRFSAEQRAIYDLVLASQKAAIAAIKPGLIWTALQDIIVRIITQGLIDLGLLRGSLDALIEQQAYFAFYMHRSGHWLGLDVHDVGRYRIQDDWRTLLPGMVFTVEPGIYISADLPGVDARWHNIGVRIEDDVVVTEQGCHVLSHKLPKAADEIEKVMAGK